jgi:hypothetical protein
MSGTWLFCKVCYRDQVFERKYRDHGILSGGHTDWHCISCNECKYEPARSH